MSGVAIDLVLFMTGSLAIVRIARWWRPELDRPTAACVSALIPRLARWPLIVALILELGLLGWRYYPATPPSSALEPAPPVLSWMAAAAAGHADPPRVLAEKWNLLPNLAATAGLGDPRGNDPMRPAFSARFVGTRMSGSWTPGIVRYTGRTGPSPSPRGSGWHPSRWRSSLCPPRDVGAAPSPAVRPRRSSAAGSPGRAINQEKLHDQTRIGSQAERRPRG